MKSGIYRIKNLINEKSYIGSAINLRERFSAHKNYLLKNTHHNSHLQASYNKYGKSNFQYLILEYCDIEKLIEREQFYMDKYLCTHRSFGYNLSPTAGNTLGYKHTEEYMIKRYGRKEKRPINKKVKMVKSKVVTGKITYKGKGKKKSQFSSDWWRVDDESLEEIEKIFS